ncbi:hypothetical protein ANN_25252 [Periplaneta americana]|uniref:Uncharacterized protein n=1 Tax=Periplaneta americana TaxID=6978 RepID=A0ABQ8S0U1_PERAM|nr:hypothetical protein ANN_25252 [Periplaneta americana]
MSNIFKAPNRVTKFSEMAPGAPLPPQPVTTRVGHGWMLQSIYFLMYRSTYDISMQILMSSYDLNEMEAQKNSVIGAAKNLKEQHADALSTNHTGYPLSVSGQPGLDNTVVTTCLSSSLFVIYKTILAGYVARMLEFRNVYKVLVGRPEGKRPLGRPRRRWEDNIKMDLREVGYDDRDWINLAQDRDRWRAYVRAAMNLRVP